VAQAGTLVDGELVVFGLDGRPDLPGLLRRHGLTDSWRIAQAKRWCPVRYVVFDLLYHADGCLLHESLLQRRTLLAAMCDNLHVPEVIFSAGVVGTGTALYAAALAQGHEGVMAKHLASSYRPGRRSPAWRKIKPKQRTSRA
jgi:bifunctional non-homologous end joining protein LigD